MFLLLIRVVLNLARKVIPYPYTQVNIVDDSLYTIFKDKPFYCGNLEPKEENCCFNHIVGLPIHEHTRLPNPLFDYEYDLFNKLKEYKRLWILKASGLGITEFFLRLMLWFCVRNNDYKYQQF